VIDSKIVGSFVIPKISSNSNDLLKSYGREFVLGDGHAIWDPFLDTYTVHFPRSTRIDYSKTLSDKDTVFCDNQETQNIVDPMKACKFI